jgi:hypothetical protein
VVLLVGTPAAGGALALVAQAVPIVPQPKLRIEVSHSRCYRVNERVVVKIEHAQAGGKVGVDAQGTAGVIVRADDEGRARATLIAPSAPPDGARAGVDLVGANGVGQDGESRELTDAFLLGTRSACRALRAVPKH